MKLLNCLDGIEHLELGIVRIASEGVKAISTHKTLKFLLIGNCINLNDADTAPFSALTNLESLTLQKTPKLTADGINFLKSLTDLRYLDVEPLISKNGLAVLKKLPELYYISPTVRDIDRLPGSELAFRELKAFGAAATKYSLRKPLMTFWRNGCTDFGRYFRYMQVRNGYVFKYFSNSSDDKTDDAKNYVFVSYPQSIDAGTYGYYITEANTAYMCNIPTDDMLKKLAGITSKDVNFLAQKGQPRITLLQFRRKR